MEKLKKINTTLVLIEKNNKILLGQKKRGFASGTYNGIGGKQDPGETIDQAMIRECQEEIGVTPINYEKVGDIDFDMWYKGEHANMNLAIYSCFEYVGEIRETEEMRPEWFDRNSLPFDKMLQDDIIWLQNYYLQGKHFYGKVKFDKDMNMLSQKFDEIQNNKDEKLF